MMKKHNQSEHFRSIPLLIFLAYILSTIAIGIFLNGGTARNDIVKAWLFYFPLSIIVFIPAYITSCFLCKKVRKTYLKLFIFAFSIPFFNLFYFYIESFMSAKQIYLSCALGASWLFLILPSMLLAALFIPKKILKMKKECIITIYLIFIFGWGLIGLIVPIEKIKKTLFPAKRTWLWNPITTHRLEDYRSVINYIEDYKADNKVYPPDLADIEIQSKSYPFFYYQTSNNAKDFVLWISDSKYFETEGFKYCSNKKLIECMDTRQGNIITLHYYIGDWIYYRIQYD